MIPGGYQPGILGFYKKLKVNAHNKGISKIGTPANAQLWHIMRPPFTLPQSAKGFPYWKRPPCRGRILQGMSFFRAEEARRPRPKRQTRCRMHPRGTGLPWHKGNFSEGRFCNLKKIA